MDSQTSYVTNVAEQFELSGDKDWLQRQKQSCEAALAYLLTRDTNHNHLVEMANSLTSQRRSSDWLDIVWASYENAFVNAQLYGALNKWAFDESLLGDAAKAKEYTDFAAALKESFNKPISEGGFWNPDKGWYVYWRDADGKTHGDNLTVPINLTAICEGICDDPARVKQLLGTIETKMNAESLLSWPACFESYQPGEGMDDKFPKYENGDIFLAWAGFGVRAYAGYDPTIALKYVKKIAAQYDKDGLAFQRYLRANGQGAGDDILANNCNVITGLYRDVYGIQPRYNRLFISPHLVHELDGTVLNYPYHGERLKIGLSVGDYSVADGGLVVKSDVPFGVQFKNHEATLFAVRSNDPAFSVHARSTDSLSAEIIDWSASNTFKLTAGANGAQAHLTFYGLLKGHTYHLMKNGAAVATMTGESPTATVDLRSKETASFELQPS